jgi:hypothetical protein
MTPLGIISRELKRFIQDTHMSPDRVHLIALSASLHTNTDHEHRPDMLLITTESFPCIDVDDTGYFVKKLQSIHNPNTDPMPAPALPHPYANNPHYQLPWVDNAVHIRSVVTGTAYTNLSIRTLASVVLLDASTIAIAVDYELYHTTKMLHRKSEVYDWWMQQVLPNTVIYRIEKYASSEAWPPSPGYQLIPRVESPRDPANVVEFSNRHLHLWHSCIERFTDRLNLLSWMHTRSSSYSDPLHHLRDRTNAAAITQRPGDLMVGLLAEPHYPLLGHISGSDTGPNPYEIVTLSGTAAPSPRDSFVLELLEYFPEETVAQRMQRLQSGKLSYTGHDRGMPDAVMVADTRPLRTVIAGPRYLDLLSPLYTSVQEIPLEFVELIIYSHWQT